MAYKRKNRPLTEALTAYQEALVSEATVVAEEQAIAKAAVKDLKLDVTADEDTKLFDIKEVTEAVEAKVAVLDQAVRDASAGTVSQDEALTPEAIAFANQILADLETVAQKQVDALKAKNAAVVNLQQKVLDYNNTAKEINVNVAEFDSAGAVLEINNDGSSIGGEVTGVTASNYGSAEDFEVSVEVLKGEEAGEVKLSFDENGNLVVEGFSVGSDDSLTPSDDVEDLFNNLEGVEDFIASVEALYGNIAAQAAAAAAVDAAILNSLKKAGYKVYEDGQDKALAWSNVKVEDGKLVNADEKETKTFVLKALDSEGKALTYGKEKTPYGEVEIDDVLVKLPGINAGNGNITGSADVKLPDMPNVIADAAGLSEEALEKLDEAQQNIADFNKAVDAYNAAVETEKALEDVAADVKAAAEAVAEAEGAFEELGFNLVKAVDGVANGTAFDENAEDQAADLFVYGESKLTVENFDGQDVLYFGDKAADLITITKAQAESAAGKVGGDASVLDIFAYQDGANTILLVEKEAFAGNASGPATDNPDLVEVTLTGVNVADLSFEDGFLAFA